MSQIIKRPFRTDNGTDWDKHYFETSADQIKDGVIVSLEDLDLVTEKGCLIDALVAKQINTNLTPETGTYKDWEYEKYIDGRVILKRRFTLNFSMYSSNVGATAFNDIVFSNANIDTTFPFTFKKLPYVTATPSVGSASHMMILGTNVTTERMVSLAYARYNTTTTAVWKAVIDVRIDGNI